MHNPHGTHNHAPNNKYNIGMTTLPWDKSTITYPSLDFKEKISE